MSVLKKIFGQIEMTWKRLIIFSVVCGAYSAAVLLIPGVSSTALTEIDTGYECWFILAIFVVSNCKDTKDAALKCFVFFLISQPLIYLIQSPFMHENLLVSYYKPWFIQTLLTLPGGAIAYQIKKDNWISTLILAIAGAFISFSGAAFLIGSFNPLRISYTIYGLFLISTAVILGMIFCTDKKKRLVYIAIVLILGITVGLSAAKRQLNPKEYEQELSDEQWRLASCSFNNLNAEVNDNMLKITYYGNNSSGELTLINNKGEELHYTVKVENGQLIVGE